MLAEQKNTIVRALDYEYLLFPNERELIRPLIKNESANRDPIPYLYYLRALVDYLYIVSNLDTTTLVNYFLIIQNKSIKETDQIRLISYKNT